MKLLGYAVLCGFDGALVEAHVPLTSDLFGGIPAAATAIAHGLRLATEEIRKLLDGQENLVVGDGDDVLGINHLSLSYFAAPAEPAAMTDR